MKKTPRFLFRIVDSVAIELTPRALHAGKCGAMILSQAGESAAFCTRKWSNPAESYGMRQAVWVGLDWFGLVWLDPWSSLVLVKGRGVDGTPPHSMPGSCGGPKAQISFGIAAEVPEVRAPGNSTSLWLVGSKGKQKGEALAWLGPPPPPILSLEWLGIPPRC